MPTPTWLAASGTANGKFIIAGGENQTGVISSTQIYDTQTATWSTGSSMQTPVANMAFGMYNDSLLYLIGGRKANGLFSNSVQMYNSYTNTWTACTPKPGDLTSGLHGGISGNKIVVTGGNSSTTGQNINTTYVGEIDISNPKSITWTKVADFPLNAIRFPGAGVSLDAQSGLVIFSGGSYTDVFADVTKKTFAYDVNSNTWKLGPDKPTASHYFNLTPVVENDTMYMVALGGGDGVIQIDKNEWLNLGPFQFPTSINENNIQTGIQISPNPTHGEAILSFSLQNPANTQIRIVDMLGNPVLRAWSNMLREGPHDILIDCGRLPPGMYFCTINTGRNTRSIKMMKY